MSLHRPSVLLAALIAMIAFAFAAAARGTRRR